MFFLKDSLTPNATQQQTLQTSRILSWFNVNASTSYQNYINNIACPMNRSSSTYRFCVQDTILTQSPSLGQVTVRSSTDYQAADQYLSNHNRYSCQYLLNILLILGSNPPLISLVSPLSISQPYATLLTIPYTSTLQNKTNAFINVTIDRNSSSLIVQIRDGNTSTSNNCIWQNSYYSCPFIYSNSNRATIDLTYVLK